MLAAARLVALVQRGQDADQPVQAGHDVEHRDAGPERGPVGSPVRLISPETAWTIRS